jgi:hypothetical protein
MMPHHRNMVRSLCRIRESYGAALPQTMATLRFSNGSSLAGLPRRDGVTCAALLQSQPMSGAPTTEQRIRGGDATADWVVLLGGDDVRQAARQVDLPGATLGFYRLAYSLGGA